MLDVHPPEHAAHTWRDFFIHIATIVVGLLIAIGLESAVEWAHHRHQVAETREALRNEREKNLAAFAENTKRLRRETAWLSNDIVVLSYVKEHPGTPQEKLPGVLVWGNSWAEFSTSAWTTAQTTGITAFMPQDEVALDATVYSHLDAITDTNSECWRSVSHAVSYRFFDRDPADLSPADIEHQIELTKDLISAHYRRGVEMENLSEFAHDFQPAPSLEEMNDMLGKLTPEDSRKLAAARAITDARLAATP